MISLNYVLSNCFLFSPIQRISSFDLPKDDKHCGSSYNYLFLQSLRKNCTEFQLQHFFIRHFSNEDDTEKNSFFPKEKVLKSLY